MHTATLLHDDVVDESDMRRGQAAARMLWGNEATVLVGDFLLGQAFKMMVEVGSLPCLEVLSSAAVVIAEGEVMQLSAAKDTETTEEAYLHVIRAKTAALFAAACEVGPILAARSRVEIAACRDYGANLGVAFQLIDDALDYGGSSVRLGKNTGDDFREGKITLPVLLSFRRGSPEERDFWRRTLEKGEIVEGDLEFALAAIKKRRALEDTIERARHYGAMARDALELFPPSPWKEALHDRPCALRRARLSRTEELKTSAAADFLPFDSRKTCRTFRKALRPRHNRWRGKSGMRFRCSRDDAVRRRALLSRAARSVRLAPRNLASGET
jgi:octaprenyl-diphosphate synthase